MPRRLVVVLCAGVVFTAGCSNRLTPENAAAALGAEYPPDPVMRWANADEFLSRLAAEGLVEFTPGDFFARIPARLALTEQGRAMGLEVIVDTIRAPDWVDTRLRFKLCDLVFDTVSALTELRQDPVRATEVHYVRRYENHTEFFDWLASHGMPRRECAKDTTFEGRAVFVLSDEGWALNQPPAFPDSVGTEVTTNFEYDDYGRLVGAVTRMKVGATPVDPEGDPVTFAWSGWWLSDQGREDAALEAGGTEASWRRLIQMGEPAGGRVFYVARDAWENADTIQFCIEGYGFRC
jgi:hypothetical protein